LDFGVGITSVKAPRQVSSSCITSSPAAGRERERGREREMEAGAIAEASSPLASKKLSCSAVRLPAGGMAAGGGGGSVGGLEALAMKG